MLLSLAFALSLLCQQKGLCLGHTLDKRADDVKATRYASGENADEVQAVDFLKVHDKLASEVCYDRVVAEWKYATNITTENKKQLLDVIAKGAIFEKEGWKNATSFGWKSFKDPTVRRWFKSLAILGNAALPEDELKELNALIADMTDIYSTAKICPHNQKDKKVKQKCNLNLEPEMKRILQSSRDYEELKHVWKSFRDESGKKLKDKYVRYVQLLNQAAKLNGFENAGELWREPYESDTFVKDLDDLWEQLRPLYEQIHAYVRRRLINEYGKDLIKPDGPIPAHLLGSMWAQSWENIQNSTLPFPGQPSVDVTNTIVQRNLSALDIFKLSDEFFTSLGLIPMPQKFWDHSILEKPKDREIVCHASAWDFCNGVDFRVKQCTDQNMRDMITAHHEMGHIEYFLQYAHQPLVFRQGANPGFHEAIGDVLALSVSTPVHLKKIGLLDQIPEGKEGDINFLYSVALKKLAFQPSGYLIDLWRWRIFSGEYKQEEMNAKWWELRLKYQGLCPPVKRTEDDFDPGAKFHVPADTPYIRYFVSTVVQYQFYKALCDAANHTGPLYTCDIYESKEAGKLFSDAMKIGSSQPWTEVMKVMTRGKTDKMDAQPILDYFAPLIDWLKEQNKNEVLGWKSDDPTICP